LPSLTTDPDGAGLDSGHFAIVDRWIIIQEQLGKIDHDPLTGSGRKNEQ